MKRILLFFVLFLVHSGMCFCNVGEYKNAMIAQARQLPGWCSIEKSEAMMDLILETWPSICVEIGVYGGRSLIPMSAALAYNQHGIVIGIDPWAFEECVKNYPEDHIVSEIWKKQDLETLYNGCINKIRMMGLQEYTIILRQTSQEVDSQIDNIDILHIDGNHSERSTLYDVTTYLKKVRIGGYIWLDDVLRGTTVRAYSLVRKRGKLIKSIDNGNCELWQKIR